MSSRLSVLRIYIKRHVALFDGRRDFFGERQTRLHGLNAWGARRFSLGGAVNGGRYHIVAPSIDRSDNRLLRPATSNMANTG
jgi:hypothetical protein